MMKHILLLITALFSLNMSASDIVSGKQYRIVCSSSPNGTLYIGAEHGSSAVLYHATDYTESEDAWWTFTEQADGSYSVMNAKTGQYITYTTERIENSTKGLMLTATDEGEASHWKLTDGEQDGYFYVSTDYSTALQKGDSFWNLRSGTGLLGTYNRENYAQNEQFKMILRENGGNGGETGGNTGVDKKEYTVIEGGEDAIVVNQTGNRITVIPVDYIKEIAVTGDNSINVALIHDKSLDFDKVISYAHNDYPADENIPAFNSYKFNNKYNPQIMVDAESDAPQLGELSLNVDGIGRWLTASFKINHDGAVAYIGDVLQKSKVTRQRFDGPMTYTVGYPTWRRVELREYADESVEPAYMPWGREQVVNVNWLCDAPTSEYGVPRIDINLTDSPDASWSSSWIGMNGSKGTYRDATITIDGAGIYPDMKKTDMVIKGRGNSTWSNSSTSKNPYHFKFSKKQAPLGMSKGKHWVLLSNKQAGSMTSNALGHKVSQLMGVRNPIHIIPVDLYVQGSYRGSYNLCERVGFGSNNVDIDDETYAAMVELDTYNDETIHRDNFFSLPAKMKDPDFEPDYDGVLTPEMVTSDWQKMLEKVYYASQGNTDSDFLPYLDRDAIATYLATCELNMHCEIKHPKSVFFYSENVIDDFSIEAGRDTTSWIAGPYWDCDWAFGYEQGRRYFDVAQTEDFFTTKNIGGGDSGGRPYYFWTTLRNNKEIDKAYYYIWHDFMENGLPELLDYCDEYYEFARKSFDHSHNDSETLEGKFDFTDYENLAKKSKAWFKQRAEYIYSKLTPYPLPEEPVEPEPEYPEPDNPLVGIDHIDATATATEGNGKLYDLLGRRIISRNHGITIVDGRKVMP